MKISMLIPILSQYDATTTNFIEKYDALKARGHDVHVFVQHECDNVGLDYSKVSFNKLSTLSYLEKKKNMFHPYFFHYVLLLLFTRPLLPFKYIFKLLLRKLISLHDRQNKPKSKDSIDFFRSSDVYIFEYSGYYKLFDIIKELKQTGKKVFVDFNGITPYYLCSHDKYICLFLLSSEQQILRTLHYADRVICHSNFIKSELITRHNCDSSKIHVLHNTLDTKKFILKKNIPGIRARYHHTNQQIIITSIGRISEHKGYHLTLQAFSLLHQKYPQLRLIFIGKVSPSYLHYLESLIKLYSLQDKITIYNELDDDQLLEIYAITDIYISASYHEGFCLPLVESMAAGIPVISSMAGAQPEIAGDAAFYFKTGDFQDLSRTINYLLSNPSIIQKYIKKGIQLASSYDRVHYRRKFYELWDLFMKLP